MIEYNSQRIYDKGLPFPWYVHDNCLNDTFETKEEYSINQTFANGNNIKYHVDENGFRKSNNLESKLWFFGCSITFGEAVEYQNIFPKIVSDQLNQNFYNFGTCGASLNLIARLLFKLRNQLDDKILVFLLPNFQRYETMYQDTFINLVPNNPLFEELSPEKNLLNFLDYNILQAITTIDAISSKNKRLFLSLGQHKFCNLVKPIDLLKTNSHQNKTFIDFGLDDMHPGIKSHQNIAEIILSQL